MEIIALVALVAGAWWLIRHYRSPGHVEDQWRPLAPAPSPRAESSTHDRHRASEPSVVASLTMLEARLQATTLSFAVAILFAALSAGAMLGWIDIYDNAAVVGRLFLHFGILAYPVTGMALIATNRAVLRDRREGTTELTLATPVGHTPRTLAAIVGAWPFAVLLLVAMTVLAVANTTGATPANPAGGWGPGWLPESLLAIALVAGGAALGGALARWIPFGLAAPVALIAIFFASGALNGLTHRARFLAPWTAPPPHLAPEFMIRPSWRHLTYVIGLVGIVLIVALLRHHRNRAVAIALALTVALTVGAALMQLSTPSIAEFRRIAERVNEPGHRCRESGTVRACTASGYERWQSVWIRGAEDVRATIPVTSPTYAAIQTVGDRGRGALEPGVRERVTGMSTGYGYAGGRRADERGELNMTWWVLPSHAAVGLPRVVPESGRPCYSGGQARAVVAVWALIVATGSDFEAWYESVAAEADGIGDTWDAASAPWAITYWPATWDTDTTVPVVYARTDVRLALALAQRSQTKELLRAGWERWTDPATTSAELAQDLSVADPTDATTTRVPSGLRVCT